MVQPVAELGEQGRAIGVRKKRGLVPARWGKVADKMRDRGPEAAGDPLPRDRLVHPRTAALGFPRVQVQIKLADQAPVQVGNSKKTHLRMPSFSCVRKNTNAIEGPDKLEHAF